MAIKGKNIFLSWLSVILWMALIFYLSSIPGKDIPRISIPHIDKAVHFAEFLVLGFLLIKAILALGCSNINLAKAVILSIIIAFAYAFIGEWHQGFISSRMPDILDLIADFIGISAGIFIYLRRDKIGNSNAF